MVRIFALLLCIASAASASDPSRADHLMRAAQDRYDRGRYLEAIRHSEAAAQADPVRWQAWKLDGDARLALGDRQSALTVYAYSLYLNPDQPELRNLVGKVAGSRRPPPLPGPQTRFSRRLTTGVELLGSALALGSATFSYALDPDWSAGFLVGGGPGGLVSLGAFTMRYLRAGTWTPVVVGGVTCNAWPYPGQIVTGTLGIAYEMRDPSGFTLRAGVYGHIAVRGTVYTVSKGESESMERPGHAWVWPGLSIGFSR